MRLWRPSGRRPARVPLSAALLRSTLRILYTGEQAEQDCKLVAAALAETGVCAAADVQAALCADMQADMAQLASRCLADFSPGVPSPSTPPPVEPLIAARTLHGAQLRALSSSAPGLYKHVLHLVLAAQLDPHTPLEVHVAKDLWQTMRNLEVADTPQLVLAELVHRLHVQVQPNPRSARDALQCAAFLQEAHAASLGEAVHRLLTAPPWAAACVAVLAERGDTAPLHQHLADAATYALADAGVLVPLLYSTAPGRLGAEALGEPVAAQFGALVRTPAWRALVAQANAEDSAPGPALGALQYTFALVCEHLSDANAAQVYEQLVGDVLLCESGPLPTGAALRAVEDARAVVLQWLRHRWMHTRAVAGFDTLQRWCLKELAQELGVDAYALRLEPPSDVPAPPQPAQPSGASTLAMTSAGLQERGRQPGGEQQQPEAERGSAETFAPAAERCGPVSLHAAALNRHAARRAAGN